MVADWTTLKGKFFHDFDEKRNVVHQGIVLDYLTPEIIVVEYFGWHMGEPNTIHAKWLKDAVERQWALYTTDKDMKEAFTRDLGRRSPNFI